MRLLAATCFTLGVSALSASAATMSFLPTADGDTRTWSSNLVDTTSTTIGISQSGGLEYKGIFEFDLSALAGVTVTGAELTMTQTRFNSNTGGNPAVFDAFVYLGDGVIDITDHTAAATQVINSTVPNGGVRGDQETRVFTSLTTVQSAIDGAGLLTLRLETDSFASLSYFSLENTDADAIPAQLNITYDTAAVPLPASLPLLGAALIGIAAFRRRTRSRG